MDNFKNTYHKLSIGEKITLDNFELKNLNGEIRLAKYSSLKSKNDDKTTPIYDLNITIRCYIED